MAEGIDVRGAVFEPLGEPLGDLVMRVSIAGSGFVDRAIPLVGRVGEARLQRIMVAPDGGGVVGFLDTQPAEGARLAIGYAGGVLVETEIAYNSGGGEV